MGLAKSGLECRLSRQLCRLPRFVILAHFREAAGQRSYRRSVPARDFLHVVPEAAGVCLKIRRLADHGKCAKTT